MDRKCIYAVTGQCCIICLGTMEVIRLCSGFKSRLSFFVL
nr:MAG TPA: hypothetical protein [Caudoviricetes sp.]